MTCKHCGGKLEILRVCRSVKMKCTECRRTFSIGQVIHLLDEQTLLKLEAYNVVIYD
jgi:hypothetical protein